MKSIYILGAGGQAKDTAFLISEINKTSASFAFKGFIDKGDQKNFLERMPKSTSLAMGVANPEVLQSLAATFVGYDFPNLIHPSSLGDFAGFSMGVGNIIAGHCSFTSGVKMGNFNIFNVKSIIGHDVTLGDGNVVNPGANISGSVQVGSYNLFGAGSIVLQNLKVGSNSILGAAALLTHDLESRKLSLGIPARVVRDL